MSYMSWCHVIFTKCSQVKVHDPDVLTGSASRLPRKTENTQSKKCPLPTSSNSVWAPGPWSLGEKFAGDVLVLEAHQHVGGRAAPIPHGPFQGLQQGEGPEKIRKHYGKVGWIMYA